MAVVEARRRLTRDEIAAGEVRQRGDCGAEQRRLDALAAPGLLAGKQRREDALRREHTRQDVADRQAAAVGGAVWIAGDAGDAAHALQDDVVAGPVGLGTLLAEAGDRAVDEPRIAGEDVIVPEAQSRHQAGPEVLDKYVGLLNEPPERLAPAVALEVERDAALIAITGQEVGAFPALKRRPPVTAVVAGARLLHLDDVRAQVAH